VHQLPMDGSQHLQPSRLGAELDQFVLSRLYTDGEGEMYRATAAFQSRLFGTVALPLYASWMEEVRSTFTGLTRDRRNSSHFFSRART